MAAADLPAWASGAIAIATTAGTAWWLKLNEAKKRREVPEEEANPAQVVAATFTERGQMERLTTALVTVERAVVQSSTIMGDLVGLLKAEAQRRHDEAIIRQALKDRGIIEP